MNTVERFVVTLGHVALLEHAHVRWEDGEFGAPAIDPKRPYGNSDVYADVARIVDHYTPHDDDPEFPTDAQRDRYDDLHREMVTVLQILCQHPFNFRCGIWVRRSGKWVDP